MRGLNTQSHVTFWSRGHLTNKKHYKSTFTRPMDPKISKMVTYDERTPPTKSRDYSISRSRDKSKTLHLHFLKVYDPKLSRMMTSKFGIPPTKSHNRTIKCSCEKSKYFIFIFTRRKAHKLSRMVTRMRRPHPTCHLTPRLHRHVTTIQW